MRVLYGCVSRNSARVYTCINVYTCIILYILKKSHFFACNVRALGNQAMLVRTRQRVKYLCLFVLLVHASNSVRSCTKLHRCTLLSPHESPWSKLFHFGDASSFLNMTGMIRRSFRLLPLRTGHGNPTTNNNRAVDCRVYQKL
jgi:hypothetical protein